MECQRRYKKEKYEHDAQLDEKKQHQSAEFFLVDFEEMRREGCTGFPKQQCRAEIEQGE